VRQRVAAHDQQFERVVEGGRIGLAGVDQGQILFRSSPSIGEEVPVSRARIQLYVAAHGVDLAVVRDHAERVGELPGREGIGRETLVHQGQRRNAARILQVEVVLPTWSASSRPL
jgi:hypothetical protein